MNTNQLAWALTFADRRDWLGKNQPTCECGSRQVQLVKWTQWPAEWRCRDCGFSFKYEPPLNAEDLD